MASLGPSELRGFTVCVKLVLMQEGFPDIFAAFDLMFSLKPLWVFSVPCYIQDFHHDGGECILARYPPRLLPQLHDYPTHHDGGDSHGQRIPQQGQQTTAVLLRSLVLFLEMSFPGLHGHGLPPVVIWTYHEVLGEHLLCATYYNSDLYHCGQHLQS